MSILSNKDIERKAFDREENLHKKAIPSYNDEYKKFRQKYKSSPRKPIEAKNFEDDRDEENLNSELELD